MPFSPSDISGLQFWLRADDLALSDGDPVGTWTDRGGGSHNFTQATSGAKPLYKTNIAGSMPGVLFDGTDDYLDGGDLQSLFPSAATLFIVFQTVGNNKDWVLARNNGNDTWFYKADQSGQGYMGVFRTARIGGYPAAGVFSNANGRRQSFALKSSSSTYQVFVNGTAQTAQTASYDDGSTYFYLGGSPSDPQGQNRWFPGYLFEVIAYDSALSSTDIASLSTYANSTWHFGPQPVNQITETDTANAVTPRRTKAFSQAFETDTAQAVTIRGFLGRALETDTANAFTASRAYGVAQVTETDAAQVFTAQETFAFAQATETDTANPFTLLTVRSVARVSETDTARGIFPTNGSGHPHPGVPDPTTIWTLDLLDPDG